MRYAAVGTCLLVLIITASARAATHAVQATLVGSFRDDGSRDADKFSYVAGDINSAVNRNYFLFDWPPSP